MQSDESVFIMCELDQADAIEFLARCQAEGVTFSEKVTELMQKFLPKGDNHLLKKSA